MNPYLILALVLGLFLFSGCASSDRIMVENQHHYEAINQDEITRQARVTMRNGDQYRAWKITAAVDSTKWYGKRVSSIGRKKSYVVSTDQIRQIKFASKTKPVSGLAIGAASGLIIGFTLPYWEPNTDCSSFNDETILGSCRSFSIVFGSLGAFLGGLTGTFIGSANNSTRVYIFHH